MPTSTLPESDAAILAKAEAFRDDKHHLRLYHADCLDIRAALPEDSIWQIKPPEIRETNFGKHPTLADLPTNIRA